MAQFWVRMQRLMEDVIRGERTKRKKQDRREEFCIKCFISGAATAKGRSHWLAERSTHTKWACCVPRCCASEQEQKGLGYPKP